MRASIVLQSGFVGAICLLASGCGISQWAHNGFKVGPNYQPPGSAVAENWIDAGDERVVPVPSDHPDWWLVFDDPVVDDLVHIAYEQNLTLRQAATRIMQARASRAITAGNLFPQVQQSFGAFTRIQNSNQVAVPPPLRAFDEWEAGFNTSWEIDVWGKIRRAIESDDARLDASIEEYDAILVSLIAEVVTAYVDIRTFEERLRVARQNVKVQRSSMNLSKTRAKEGATGDLGVALADANVNGTEATIPNLETSLRQASNRLCTLLGMPPRDVSELLEEGDGIPTVPPEIAVGIPADLLRRRPDVRQAERLVAAQSAQIGVAKSDLYPSIAINGEIFQASENFSDLLRSGSNAGSVGPAFQWKILNYGRIQNNIRLQDARLEELVAAYQNTVLVANQEVEDALVAFLKSQEQVDSLGEVVKDLEESLRIVKLLFEEGKIDFSPIFVVQGALREAQDRLATAEGEVLLNMIAVYRALGGGWQIRCPNSRTRPVAMEELEYVPNVEAIPIPEPAGEDGDGEVSLEELPAQQRRSFEEADNE